MLQTLNMRQYKTFLYTLFLLFTSSVSGFSQTNGEIDNMRSDTIDVLDYQIKMDLTQMSNQSLSASCKVSFESKMNTIDGISLDLLELTLQEAESD